MTAEQEAILKALARHWEANPNLRFFQLLCTIAHKHLYDLDTSNMAVPRDPYFVENCCVLRTLQ